MELPFYLMSPGMAWDGTISVGNDTVHVVLEGAGDRKVSIDLPIQELVPATFQRGLRSRTLTLEVDRVELLQSFPEGVEGKQLELMVARPDPTFGTGVAGGEYEKMVDQICRTASPAAREGLAS